MIKFRCSGLAKLMTNGRNKNEAFGDTAKGFILDTYLWHEYKRREELSSKYLEKGNEREEDSITLVSRAMKNVLFKNSERLTNDFITGEPDLYLCKEGNTGILNAHQTIDTKSCWSLRTFYDSKMNQLKTDYYWQGQGYMALTGAQTHVVAFCLVNGLPKHIDDVKRKTAWQMGIIDGFEKPEAYLRKCQQIERNMIFDLRGFLRENPGYDLDHVIEDWQYDLPWTKRIHMIQIERDENAIETIYERVKQANQWMEENLNQ